MVNIIMIILSINYYYYYTIIRMILPLVGNENNGHAVVYKKGQFIRKSYMLL